MARCSARTQKLSQGNSRNKTLCRNLFRRLMSWQSESQMIPFGESNMTFCFGSPWLQPPCYEATLWQWSRFFLYPTTSFRMSLDTFHFFVGKTVFSNLKKRLPRVAYTFGSSIYLKSGLGLSVRQCPQFSE